MKNELKYFIYFEVSYKERILIDVLEKLTGKPAKEFFIEKSRDYINEFKKRAKSELKKRRN